MTDIKTYIEKNFSNELKCLIVLSQETPEFEKISPLLTAINWDKFIELCLKHRLVSHVLKHSSFLADNIPIPIYEKLIERRLDQSKKSLNYAVHAIRIYQKFSENNIAHLFLKAPYFPWSYTKILVTEILETLTY